MAKSVHSKRRKKNKAIQRRVLWEAQGKKEHEDIHKRLMKRAFGAGDDDYISRKKNAFRYPNDPSAIIPKHAEPVYIDKRSAHIPITLRVRPKGVKAYKIEERRQKAEVENALKAADEKILGENKGHIDLSKMDTFNMDIEEELNKLNVLTKSEAKKAKREKKDTMEVDQKTNVSNTIRQKNKKKSKSHYIVNH